jgi:hypothetical protein
MVIEEAGMTWILLGAIVLVLGVAVWWGNRKAKQVQEDTEYLAKEGEYPQAFRFRRVNPWRR